MFSRNTSVLIIALVLAACGRDPIPIPAEECPPPPTCDCSAIQAELDALKAKQLVKPASPEEDERNCNSGYAILKDPSGLERFNQQKAKVEAENKKAKDQIAKMEQDASQLPEPPVVLGAAPSVTEDLGNTLVSYPFFNKEEKKCKLEVKGEPQDPIIHSDWRYFAIYGLAKWNESNLYNEPEGFTTDMKAAALFTDYDGVLTGSNTDERRVQADMLISLLAKSGPAVQWAVGVAKRMESDDAAFAGRQLKRLYAATKLDFTKLDKDIRAAADKVKADHPDWDEYTVESALPTEYDFGPKTAANDGYYKGLVLRYWRYKEAIEKGGGKAAVAKLQQVLRGVASGMEVNLK